MDIQQKKHNIINISDSILNNNENKAWYFTFFPTIINGNIYLPNVHSYIFNKYTKYIIYSSKICSITNKMYFHCYIYFYNNKQYNEIQNILVNEYNTNIYLSHCKFSIDENIEFFKKILYPFKNTILESVLIKNKDNHKIDIIFDKIGNSGKSFIADYIHIYKKGYNIYPLNDYMKLVDNIYNILIKNNDIEPKLLIFDLQKVISNNKLYNLIKVFSQIKKGEVFSSKYIYRKWYFYPPRIWIFCNKINIINILSRDKYNIWIINKNKELVKYLI